MTKNISSSLGIPYNDPAGQVVLEAWTVLLAVKYWAFLLKADSTVALAVSKKLSSATPTLNWVGAELSFVLEAQNMGELTVHHLPGKLNVVADHLSRPDKEGPALGLERFQVRVMNEAWMLDSRLPRSTGASGIVGLLPLFDGL